MFNMKPVGMHSHPDINDGNSVPLYETATVEKQREQERRYLQKFVTPRFIAEYGREPLNHSEAWAYNRTMAKNLIASSIPGASVIWKGCAKIGVI